MSQIDKKKALKLYKNKILDLNKNELLKEIELLFNNLSTDSISSLLERLKINYLLECGIDEKELDNIIDELESDDIYITEECIYRSYWDEDYEYYDTFNIAPILYNAVNYCYILFENKQYEKAYELGNKLLNIECNCHCVDENNEYYDDYWYGINDFFSRLNYSFDYFKFKSLVFSLALQSDNYSKEAFNINDYFSCYDSEIDLSYIYDKDKFNNRLLELLNILLEQEELTISIKLLSFFLKYINDKLIFKKFAYKFGPLNNYIFDQYYEYMYKNNEDTSKIITDALAIFTENKLIEKYANLALSLGINNDTYRINLYNSNPNNLEYFFMLYENKDIINNIENIVKTPLHKALAVLNKQSVSNLLIEDLIPLLDILINPIENYYSDKITNNIKAWKSTVNINNEIITYIYNNAIKELDDLCNETLGKNRDFYYALGKYIKRLNDFGLSDENLIIKYSNRYNRYPSFKKILKGFLHS